MRSAQRCSPSSPGEAVPHGPAPRRAAPFHVVETSALARDDDGERLEPCSRSSSAIVEQGCSCWNKIAALGVRARATAGGAPQGDAAWRWKPKRSPRHPTFRRSKTLPLASTSIALTRSGANPNVRASEQGSPSLGDAARHREGECRQDAPASAHGRSVTSSRATAPSSACRTHWSCAEHAAARVRGRGDAARRIVAVSSPSSPTATWRSPTVATANELPPQRRVILTSASPRRERPQSAWRRRLFHPPHPRDPVDRTGRKTGNGKPSIVPSMLPPPAAATAQAFASTSNSSTARCPWPPPQQQQYGSMPPPPLFLNLARCPAAPRRLEPVRARPMPRPQTSPRGQAWTRELIDRAPAAPPSVPSPLSIPPPPIPMASPLAPPAA